MQVMIVVINCGHSTLSTVCNDPPAELLSTLEKEEREIKREAMTKTFKEKRDKNIKM